jgi:ABC-type oligopeptide transport system ATPase subunit
VTGVSTEPGAAPQARPGGEPLLRVERLSRHFRIGGALSRHTLHAVDDATFSVGERQIVAVAGESGSGKSTVARVLAKIYKPTSGEVYFQDETGSGTAATFLWCSRTRSPRSIPCSGSRTACCAH